MSKLFTFIASSIVIFVCCSSAMAGISVFGIEMGSHIDKVRAELVSRNITIFTDEKLSEDMHGITTKGLDYGEDGVQVIAYMFSKDTMILDIISIYQRNDTYEKTYGYLKNKYKQVGVQEPGVAYFETKDYSIMLFRENEPSFPDGGVKVDYTNRKVVDALIAKEKSKQEKSTNKY